MSKVMAFMSSFTMTTHQIWSCHVTLATNFENFYLSPYSTLNFRKRCQIWGKLAQEQKSYRQKTKLGVENTPPPVHIALNQAVLEPRVSNVPYLGFGQLSAIS